MARDKVELLVEIVGKDGVNAILSEATKQARKVGKNLKKSEKEAVSFSKKIGEIGSAWGNVAVGLNQGLELFDKMIDAAVALKEQIKETARLRQVEQRFTQQLNVSVQELAEASGFQLTDIGLQQFALQAQQAGVSMQDFKGLLDLSLKASAASGKEFKQIFEGIFVDTVVGASDSFLEQIGIVADMGTITEAYAKKMGIAKDAIDKTTQKQAMLNFLLTDAKDKFEDVAIDEFSTDLARLEKDVERFQATASKAFTMAAEDALQFFGIIRRRGPNSIQRYRDNVAALDKLMARIKSYKFGDRAGELSANREAEILRLMKVIGKSARSSELSMRMLFDRIHDEAKALSELGGTMLTQQQRAHAYDEALKMLAKQYGVLDIAEQKYTTESRARIGYFNYAKDKVGQLAEAFSGLAFQMGKVDVPVDDFERIFGSDDSDYMQTPAARAGLEPMQDKSEQAEKKRKKAETAARRKRYRERVARLRAAKRERERALRQAQAKTKDMYDALAKRQANLNAMLAEQRAASVKTTEDFYKSIALESEEANRLQAYYAEEEAAQVAERTQVITDSVTAMRDGFSETGRAVMLMGDALGYTGERMRDMQMIAQGMEQVGESIKTVTAASIEFDANNETVGANYAAFASTLVDAAGQAALGFIKGERERAGVLAAMEYAHAGAALATGILTGAPNAYVASAIHLANAGLYTAIASGAGGGGSRGASAGGAGRGASGAAGAQGARRLPQFGQQMQSQDMQPAQVVVNMSGAIVAGANRRKTANDLGDLVQESMAGRR